MTRVTLLTDFGTADGYAAAMAGVIAAGAPDAVTEHVTHDIAPGDVLAAALALSRYATIYPEGTVHVAVVDPGVGTARRPIAARVAGRLYVAPDNGVLTRVIRETSDLEVVEIRSLEGYAPASGHSATFHGRDVFAPAAARLAAGGPLDQLGPPVDDPVVLALPEPVRDGGRVDGEVIQVDRFGNLITNIPDAWLGGTSRPRIRVEGVEAGPLRRTYGDVESGEIVALIGSLGLLEVSVRDDSAADRLGAGRGARVVCESRRGDG